MTTLDVTRTGGWTATLESRLARWAGVAERRREPEEMDDPALDARVHEEGMRGLARANRVSNTAAVLWRAMASHMPLGAGRPLRLLDVASGTGDVAIRIAQLARRTGREVEVHLCDRSPRALALAAQRGERAAVPVWTYARDVLAAPLPGVFDVVTCALFLHHLDEPEAVEALTKMRAATGRLLLVSDLRRSAVGLVMTVVGTRLLSRSRVFRDDGIRSIHAAYTLAEAQALAHSAALDRASIRPYWPARFLLAWRRA